MGCGASNSETVVPAEPKESNPAPVKDQGPAKNSQNTTNSSALKKSVSPNRSSKGKTVTK